MTPCICITPGPVILHDGHCCLGRGQIAVADIPRAEGYPPAPACHPDEWRAEYGANHPPQQPELPQEFLTLVERQT